MRCGLREDRVVSDAAVRSGEDCEKSSIVLYNPFLGFLRHLALLGEESFSEIFFGTIQFDEQKTDVIGQVLFGDRQYIGVFDRPDKKVMQEHESTGFYDVFFLLSCGQYYSMFCAGFDQYGFFRAVFHTFAVDPFSRTIG